MLVCIRGTEEDYEGLYGIENVAVVDVEKADQAYKIGLDMACCLIEDYDCWDDEIAEFETTEDFYKVHGFNAEVWTIKDNITYTDEELNDILWHIGWEDFVEEYCDKELC